MRILITGGRDFADVECINEVLDMFKTWYPALEVAVVGEFVGVAAVARDWAKGNGVCGKAFPGGSALAVERFNPQMVISFPGGEGAAQVAEDAGVDVYRVSVRKVRS